MALDEEPQRGELTNGIREMVVPKVRHVCTPHRKMASRAKCGHVSDERSRADRAWIFVFVIFYFLMCSSK